MSTPAITVELVKPRRLRLGNKTWERGVALPCDLETAMDYMEDERFLVRGVVGKQAVALEDLMKKPRTEYALMTAIQAAVAQLDDDDASCWTKDGEPNWRAVKDLLGYPVTEDEVKKADGWEPSEADRKRAATATDMLPERGDITMDELKHGTKGKGNIRITRRTPGASLPAPAPRKTASSVKKSSDAAVSKGFMKGAPSKAKEAATKALDDRQKKDGLLPVPDEDPGEGVDIEGQE